MTDSLYLIRFDDVCPTMNWAVWDQIEAELVRLELRPILAVVPDNRDPKLVVAPERPDFWERVRGWQARGWTIALHGHQHLYTNMDPGIIGLTPHSEFAGLPRAEQEDKLRRGLAIFAANGVEAQAWIAPSHSFDRTTVATLASLGVKVISDGLWPRPFKDRAGVTWIPQQLWSFGPRPDGVWTVCLHINRWSAEDLRRFLSHLAEYQDKISSLTEVLGRFGERRLTLQDRLAAWYSLNWSHGLRRRLSRAKRLLHAMNGRTS